MRFCYACLALQDCADITAWVKFYSPQLIYRVKTINLLRYMQKIDKSVCVNSKRSQNINIKQEMSICFMVYSRCIHAYSSSCPPLKACVLSCGSKRRTLPRHRSEQMKIYVKLAAHCVPRTAVQEEMEIYINVKYIFNFLGWGSDPQPV